MFDHDEVHPDSLVCYSGYCLRKSFPIYSSYQRGWVKTNQIQTDAVAFNSNQTQRKQINLSSHLMHNTNTISTGQEFHMELDTLAWKTTQSNLKRPQLALNLDDLDHNSKKKWQITQRSWNEKIFFFKLLSCLHLGLNSRQTIQHYNK